MKKNKYWERFEQTGAIWDYLNYTACTSESTNQNIENKIDSCFVIEGGVCEYGCSEYDGHGAVSDAGRRL